MIVGITLLGVWAECEADPDPLITVSPCTVSCLVDPMIVVWTEKVTNDDSGDGAVMSSDLGMTVTDLVSSGWANLVWSAGWTENTVAEFESKVCAAADYKLGMTATGEDACTLCAVAL